MKRRTISHAAHRSSAVKIGIDVGGTFTHAVAVDAASLTLVGKSMVPTTHTAKEGVAKGVVDAMQQLLRKTRITPRSVTLIAHSTTQATNALLEGDVARVGIIGMGSGADAWRAKSQTRISGLLLAPGRVLQTDHAFYDTTEGVDDAALRGMISDLVKRGAEVFAVSEAFGVDRPENEQRVAELIRSMGYHATAASDISQLYGLKVRTRTAAINASMLPKMLEAADMTERAVRASGIRAPLMIMRSDGGIMDVAEMRRRPILTMLSGPAAGVAAALMYVKISDGIFLEVGGTSTDISVIKNGRAMTRTAEVGGHRLFLRTLDIRTLGIGGGSMVRWARGRVEDVGPRSAHIAGLHYLAFASPKECEGPRTVNVQPRPGDPQDYLAIQCGGAKKRSFAVTPTEAANILGLVQGYARGNSEVLKRVLDAVAKSLETSVEAFAEAILSRAAAKVRSVVERFLLEYKLDPELLALVGGGGGAETIVPYTARTMKMEHWIAEHAEVISAIGVALGMVRESIERTVVAPTEADILKIRGEAMEAVLRMGAAADSVDVLVEVDSRQKRLRATATGVPEFRARDLRQRTISEAERLSIAARSLGAPETDVKPVGGTAFLSAYQTNVEKRRFLGLRRQERKPVRVVDREGIVRLKLADAVAHPHTVASVPGILPSLIEDHTVYGDAGGLLPDVFVLIGGRILDLSGLASRDQVMAIVRVELERFGKNEPLLLLISGR